MTPHAPQQPPRWLRPKTPRALGMACLGAVCWLAIGCGASTQSAPERDLEALLAEAHAASPELQEVSKSLTSLEARADALTEKVQGLERLVLSQATAQDATSFLSAGGALFIEVESSGVLKLNGAATSPDEVTRYIRAQGKQVCQPQPTLVVDPKAQYDLVARILDEVYGQGCGEVNLVQQSPSRLRGR